MESVKYFFGVQEYMLGDEGHPAGKVDRLGSSVALQKSRDKTKQKLKVSPNVSCETKNICINFIFFL